MFESIAIFGGSFDPVHAGHVAVVKAVLANLKVEKLFVVPTFLNPFKHEFCAPPEFRLRWCRAVFCEEFANLCEVCDFEVKSGRAVASIETVLFLREKFKPKQIYLVVGSDNLHSLNSWHRFNELSSLVEFVVVTREENSQNSNLTHKNKTTPNTPRYTTIFLDAPISSTQIRNGLLSEQIPKPIKDEVIAFYKNVQNTNVF